MLTPKLTLTWPARLRLIIVVALFLAAPGSVAILGWPNPASYFLLALALALYAQMRHGLALWFSATFLALAAGISASDYQGSWLTTLPLLALAALFMPKGGMRPEMFSAGPAEPLAIGAIIEDRGRLRLVTALQPLPEALEMFTDGDKIVPEPLEINPQTALLASGDQQRATFLRALPRRSMLTNGALLALSWQWLLALAASAAGFIFLNGAEPALFVALLLTPLFIAAINTKRIYRHLQHLVEEERQRLRISASGALDLSALLGNRVEDGRDPARGLAKHNLDRDY